MCAFSIQYILNGHTPVKANSLVEWAESMEKTDRTVKRTTVGESRVSTVFLGLDHSFEEGATPVLFETMVFGGPDDQYQERYTTWDEAEAGHDRIVAMLERGVRLDDDRG